MFEVHLFQLRVKASLILKWTTIADFSQKREKHSAKRKPDDLLFIDTFIRYADSVITTGYSGVSGLTGVKFLGHY